MKYCIAVERLPILSRNVAVNEFAFNLHGEQECCTGLTPDARRAFHHVLIKWGRGDSNPHALRHMILSHARLPVPTLPRRGRTTPTPRALVPGASPMHTWGILPRTSLRNRVVAWRSSEAANTCNVVSSSLCPAYVRDSLARTEKGDL